jgi:hypothetical protein
VAIEAKFAPYARETAMCVDLAYSAIEEDIGRELDTVSDATRDVLLKLLRKVQERRAVLEEFTPLLRR